MPLVSVANRTFDVDVIVFDKDGTLVDFDALWGPRTVRWVETLAEMASQPELGGLLYPLVGFDPVRQQVLPDGPLAIGTTADLYALAAAVLFQDGFGWHEGRPLAQRAAATTMAAAPQPAEIRPLGDVASTVRRLRRAGIQLAVATNDDRALTEATLQQLGIAGDIAVMACGDDALPPKPDPAGLHWLAGELGTVAGRLLVVGDSANDMLAGRNAGVAGCIGILSGAGTRASLEQLADVVVDHVDALRIVT